MGERRIGEKAPGRESGWGLEKEEKIRAGETGWKSKKMQEVTHERGGRVEEEVNKRGRGSSQEQGTETEQDRKMEAERDLPEVWVEGGGCCSHGRLMQRGPGARCVAGLQWGC